VDVIGDMTEALIALWLLLLGMALVGAWIDIRERWTHV